MKIVTTVFEYSRKPYNYREMHRVFKESCKKHIPTVEFVTIPIYGVTDQKDGKRPGCWSNTVKLREYVRFIDKVNDDVILADCDMLCLQDARHAFEGEFDIGVTMKGDDHKTRCVVNGGIIFVKNTEAAKEWMREFQRINDKMYADEMFHNVWKKKYYGMNQTAMGYMLEMYDKAIVKEFPTQVWNNCDVNWANINDETVFVHIKSMLRDAIFSGVGYSDYEIAMKAWYEYQKEGAYRILPMSSREAKRRRKQKVVGKIRINPDARTRGKLRRL